MDVMLGTAPVELVTTMRPSEALRLGCLLAPGQAFGTLVGEVDVLSVGWDGSEARVAEACAIGTIALAHGVDPVRLAMAHWWSWPGPDPESGCPAVGCRYDPGSASHIAAHLNDRHEWTRARIADWLEGLGL